MKIINSPTFTPIHGEAVLAWPRRAKETVMVGIPVAAHQEDWSTIVHTLQLFLEQESRPQDFRVFLHLNSPQSEFDNQQFNETRKKLAEFVKQNPHLRLSVSQQGYKQGTTIGHIRADLWDNVCAWVRTRGDQNLLPKNIVGISTDIDAVYISEDFVGEYRSAFDEFSKYSFACGQFTYDEYGHTGLSERGYTPQDRIVSEAVNLLNISNFLAEVANNSFYFTEANTAFRLRVYERVGGIDRDKQKGEILDLEERIRQYDKPSRKDYLATLFVDDAEICTSARRQISAAAKGIPMTECWELDQHDFTQTDPLRTSSHMRYLVDGAASKIIENFDEIIDQFFSNSKIGEMSLMLALERSDTSELSQAKRDTFKKIMRYYISTVCEITGAYFEILDSEEFPRKEMATRALNEAVHEITRAQELFESLLEKKPFVLPSIEAPIMQRIMEPKPTTPLAIRFL